MSENKTIQESIAILKKFKKNAESRTIPEIISDIRNLLNELEEAWDIAEIDLREDEAKMLLREYAKCPDENLTESAKALKRELIEIAEFARMKDEDIN